MKKFFLWFVGFSCGLFGQEADTLKILTWNICMLPEPVKVAQAKRLKHIAEVLRSSDYDVIALQEVFLDKSVKFLKKYLSDKYPYVAGPPRRKFALKLTGGVYVFSKYPIKKWFAFNYSACKGWDCLASKGVVVAEIQLPRKKIQVLATHLQAGRKFQAVREEQYREIREVLDNIKEENVPQFIVGDLNTSKKVHSYKRMLATLQAEDPSGNQEFFTSYGDENDLAKFRGEGGKGKMLDYILVRSLRRVKVLQLKVRRFRREWEENRRDLSDHFGYEGVFVIR